MKIYKTICEIPLLLGNSTTVHSGRLAKKSILLTCTIIMPVCTLVSKIVIIRAFLVLCIVFIALIRSLASLSLNVFASLGYLFICPLLSHKRIRLPNSVSYPVIPGIGYPVFCFKTRILVHISQIGVTVENFRECLPCSSGTWISLEFKNGF